jgi:hypothetical protein
MTGYVKAPDKVRHTAGVARPDARHLGARREEVKKRRRKIAVSARKSHSRSCESPATEITDAETRRSATELIHDSRETPLKNKNAKGSTGSSPARTLWLTLEQAGSQQNSPRVAPN